ncbi:tripartite tricarboxylate transporter permease [uncultured Cohaesibacter sp.]|uniref:tripartite tricarboxylate transporter permease n=1 Tax=uncultured Cohaesibacter sp. TaxID=1002546 RepID=UPI0029C9578F|nr:tripartite tricarboxylate transporter permease [uncultured Cohaesibacter sp.]
MDNLIIGVSAVSDPATLLSVLFGTVVGVLIGALPGLSATMAVALLLPFTAALDPIPAIVMLAALYCGASYGGSITAILINSPGTPAATATGLDGYPMAQRGEAGRALGIATVASTIGGILSLFVLIFAAPMLAELAFDFGPPEYFGLALFGLSMLSSISGASMIKNLIGGLCGLLIATVGADFTTGVERFTFGNYYLIDGIGFIPVMIGLFSVSELFVQSGNSMKERILVASQAVKLPSMDDIRASWKTILRGSGIGTVIGVLPAEGGTVGSLIAYSQERRLSKHPEKFGTGIIQGIAAPESANNAATGGAMVPTLALGIPGSSTTAVLIGALLLQGIRPGPAMFTQQPTLIYSIFAAMLIANILFFGLGLIGAKVFARITLIPTGYLWTSVFIFSVVGAYSLNQSMADVWIMLCFGGVGYLLRQIGFSAAPIIMGVVLGEIVENSLKQSLLIFDNNWLNFFSRPIFDGFFLLTLIGISLPLFGRLLRFVRT